MARRRAAGWSGAGIAAAAMAVCGLWAAEASAQTDRYAECMRQARLAPAAAREAAAQWEAIGGGAPARHCAAIALIGLGAELRAAEILTEIGSGSDGLSPEDRVAALTLAGNLWLRNGRTALASKLYSAALTLNPESRDAKVGTARIAAEREQWADAVALLSPVIASGARTGTPDAEALTLRAAALRAGGDPQAALVDAEAATGAAPESALTWFERGAAERALGRKDAARESWLHASMLDPEGPAGELARLNLQRLETE